MFKPKILLYRFSLLLLTSFSALCLPFLLLIRFSLFPLVRILRISFWTGAPIITLVPKSHAERSLGFRSFTVVKDSYYISSDFDIVLSSIFGSNTFLITLSSYFFFLFSLLFATNVHSFLDGGFLPSLKRRSFNKFEAFSYYIFGVRLYLWSYGADVRTKEITKALGKPNCCSLCSSPNISCVCDTTTYLNNYYFLKRFSSAIFSMGDMIEYTPGSINTLFYWPLKNSALNHTAAPIYSQSSNNRPFRIVHAPNHPEFKGTNYLELACSRLRSRGYEVDLVLIQNMPNNVALKEYQRADLIFDQCLIGFHGYFALEAMALGKPVMAFIRFPEIYLLNPHECPIINTDISSLELDILNLIENPHLCSSIGAAGRRYVRKHYSIPAFASRLAEFYSSRGLT